MRVASQQLRTFIPCLLLIFVVFSLIQPAAPLSARAEVSYAGDPCHLAVTVPVGSAGYDLSNIGVASYLDWTISGGAGVASNIEHLKVLRVRDDLFASQLAALSTWVPQYPGAVWLIGNEPDTFHSNQDNVTPEVYAQRFYEMANAIHSLDPSARVGFAPIVQPTPIRIRYLNRVIDRLATTTQYGPPLATDITTTLGLIDIFTIHAFILNEQPGSAWGAGIPPGFETDYADAVIINIQTEIAKTHDITIFSAWVTAMRQWMELIGARSKPLWITEYGSLMPPLDPPSGVDLYNVTDEATRDYMLASFDFIYNTTDSGIGYSSDGNRLVQRAYWYSLNEYRWVFGGALFDPASRERTIVGDAFVAYDPPVPQVPQDPYPIGASFVPLRYTPGSGKTHVDYKVDVRVGNNVTAERLAPVVVNLTLDGIPLGPQAGNLVRCGGVGVFSFDWPDINPSDLHSLHGTVNPGSGLVDTNLNNNALDFAPTLALPVELFLPMIKR